ncbi:MAG: sigma-70 family RNA polymerase sigma factor [Planctomycetota bacterium]|jgi:RNA polymerase sigma factor (TIGR02999 family)
MDSDQPVDSGASPAGPVTRLLHDAAAGRPGAGEALLPLVYEHLLAIARRHMAGERSGHTLDATALVHEAYLKLLGDAPIDWGSRGAFYRAAASAMRRILIDHARRRGAAKRGGEWRRQPLRLAEAASDENLGKLLALDEVLLRLQEEDDQAAEIVRLRFFAGLSVDQVSATLGISPRTVKRDWAYARVWLLRALDEAGG